MGTTWCAFRPPCPGDTQFRASSGHSYAIRFVSHVGPFRGSRLDSMILSFEAGRYPIFFLRFSLPCSRLFHCRIAQQLRTRPINTREETTSRGLDSSCLVASRAEGNVKPCLVPLVEARDPILQHRNPDERAGWEAGVANFVLMLSSNCCLKLRIGLEDRKGNGQRSEIEARNVSHSVTGLSFVE